MLLCRILIAFILRSRISFNFEVFSQFLIIFIYLRMLGIIHPLYFYSQLAKSSLLQVDNCFLSQQEGLSCWLALLLSTFIINIFRFLRQLFLLLVKFSIFPLWWTNSLIYTVTGKVSMLLLIIISTIKINAINSPTSSVWLAEKD